MSTDATLTAAQRFRRLAHTPGPFASVYFDDSHDAPDAARRLDAEWRAVRRQLEDLNASPELVQRVEHAVRQSPPAVGRRGRGVIASGEAVLFNEGLEQPPPSMVVRVSNCPYILPLVEGAIRRPTFVFAAVDHAGADVTLHQGEIVRSATVDGGGYPVHKAARGGITGWDDVQPHVEEERRKNIRAIADHLTELVNTTDAEAVFICGESRSRSDVISQLPNRVAARVLQLHAGARTSLDRDQIDSLIDAEFARRRRNESGTMARRLRSQLGRGTRYAVTGLAPVCAALRDGDVDTLIVGDLGDTTVVTGQGRTMVAPDADTLSEWGQAVSEVARADEALPLAAVCVDASVVRMDDVAAADGVAALLRYAPAGSTSPESADRETVTE